MDIFCEYMVKRKKDPREWAITAGTVVGALLLSMLLTMFLGGLAFAFICGAWFGAWWLITRLDTEYEYILTSTVLDVDKIMAKRSRKRLLSIDLKEIEACRPISEMSDGAGLKLIDASPNGAEDGVYGIDFDKNGERTRLLIKTNKKMLNEMKKASPRLVTLRLEDIGE